MLADLVDKAKDYALMHGERQVFAKQVTFEDGLLNDFRHLHAAKGCVRSGRLALCTVSPPAVAVPGERVREGPEASGSIQRDSCVLREPMDAFVPPADGAERADAQGGARPRVPHRDPRADHQGGRLHRQALQDIRDSLGRRSRPGTELRGVYVQFDRGG